MPIQTDRLYIPINPEKQAVAKLDPVTIRVRNALGIGVNEEVTEGWVTTPNKSVFRVRHKADRQRVAEIAAQELSMRSYGVGGGR